MSEIRRTDVAHPHSDTPNHNVGQKERIVGGLAGAALLLLGFKKHGLLSKLALMSAGSALLYRSTTGYCSVYGVLGVDTAQDRPATPEQYFQRGVHVEKSYVIHKPAADLYTYWRDLENLPTFMDHLQSVEMLSRTRSRWTAKAPLGRTVSWEAEIIHDLPNELISWKSVENSEVANVGTVRFTEFSPGQTEVKVTVDYIPPAGQVGKAILELFGHEPSQTIEHELHRFKHLMETGNPEHAKG